MGGIGVWELIIITIMVVVIFGGKRLPELGRGLGKGLANFRQAVRGPENPGHRDLSPADSFAEGDGTTADPELKPNEPEGGRA